jgi:heme iron utilization protein
MAVLSSVDCWGLRSLPLRWLHCNRSGYNAVTMLPRLNVLIDLLHRCLDAALATHSVAMPGYPFASALPFAIDERHRPVLLISRLAEHTQNLAVDARASLMVHMPAANGDMARATLVGPVKPLEADPLLVERYLRFQPASAEFLQLGDFRFYGMEPIQARIIGGFGQAAWLAGERLTEACPLTLAQERAALDALTPALPAGVELLGVDSFGVDLWQGGQRRRVSFAAGAATPDALVAVARRALDGVSG